MFSPAVYKGMGKEWKVSNDGKPLALNYRNEMPRKKWGCGGGDGGGRLV